MGLSHSVSGNYLEAILDLMDVDEMLLEGFIGSGSVGKVRGNIFCDESLILLSVEGPKASQVFLIFLHLSTITSDFSLK